MRSLDKLNKKMRALQDEEAGEELISYILEITNQYLEIEPIRWIVEFGAHPGDGGVFLDFLINDGYRAILIEGEKNKFDGLVKQYKDNGDVVCINKYIDYHGSNTLDEVLSKTEVPKIFDVLLIDVDTIDYQIWQSLSEYKPLLAVIEFNETYGPYLKRVHNTEFNQWAARNHILNRGEISGASSIAGSSLRSITELSRSKGYMLLTYTRNNAYFIREELFHLFHLQEIDLTSNFTQMTLNIPNRVLSSKDIFKKLLRFGFYQTFLRQNIRDPKIIRVINKWRNKWKK